MKRIGEILVDAAGYVHINFRKDISKDLKDNNLDSECDEIADAIVRCLNKIPKKNK